MDRGDERGDGDDDRGDWGPGIEEYARRLAAGFGVADFVYEPLVEAVASGTREISDGLLICGDDGLILQVKARDPSRAHTDTPERAENWIRKAAKKAARQVAGTRRRLARDETVEVKSLRGFTKSVSGIGGWPGVVIIDHPSIPQQLFLDFKPDILWISLDDWYGVHEWLRSTAIVIDYVKRALATGLNPALGHEPSRYGRLAEADHSAPGGRTSIPLLPLDRIDGPDRFYVALVEEWIDTLWPREGEAWGHDPDHYRFAVELLDRIPPLGRVELGRKIVETLRFSDHNRCRKSFFMRLARYLPAQFLIVADVEERYADPRTEFEAEIATLAFVRHEQAIDNLGDEAGPTLALGRLDHADGPIRSFVYIDGVPPDMPPDVRWAICRDYGVFDGTAAVEVDRLPRNGPCPCRSGRKLKKCHMGTTRG